MSKNFYLLNLRNLQNIPGSPRCFFTPQMGNSSIVKPVPAFNNLVSWSKISNSDHEKNTTAFGAKPCFFL